MSFTAILFLLGYASGLVMALFKKPIYGLGTYVLVMFLHPPSRWWGASLPDMRWSLLAAIVTFVACQARTPKNAAADSVWKMGVFGGYVVLFLWMLIQSPWAIWPDVHLELLELFGKYLILIYLIYRIVETEDDMRVFLWCYFCGCWYLGWVAYTTYSGGRFEGFGGPDIGEANAGALTLVTGVFAGGALFLSGTTKQKIVILCLMPFIVNGMILASSRSALLAMLFGGLMFMYFTPQVYRKRVYGLGALAIVMFLMLTNSVFWGRMSTLKFVGEEQVTIVTDGGRKYDNGSGRLKIIEAQWRMFFSNPFGSGHRSTAALSPYYLSDENLTGQAGKRYRSSHNTFMSMLVEHGVVGAAVYIYCAIWIFNRVRWLLPLYRRRADLSGVMVPTLMAALGGIIIADVFVDYLKLEPRLWFVALLMVLMRWARIDIRQQEAVNKEEAETGRACLGPAQSYASGKLGAS